MPREMAIHSEIPDVLSTLKSLLKSQGLSHQDVARALNISTVTVRRHLSGRGLSIGSLEQICSVIGITMSELMELVGQCEGSGKEYLTISQEEDLLSRPFLAMIFILLSRGWSADQIKTEFELDDVALNGYLLKLDKMRLIELHPFNRVKMLVDHPFKVIPGRPLSRGFDKYVKKDLFSLDVLREDIVYRYNYFKMSKGTAQKLAGLIDNLMKSAEQLTVAERSLPKNAATWQSVFVLVSPLKKYAYPR